MRIIALGDGKRVEWEPTTDLLCTYCRIPIDVAGDPKEAMAWTNFMYDLAHPKETSLVLGHYWYLHKRCMGIEDALLMRGAQILWGWHDMKSVLGLDSALWKQRCGNVQKALRKRMPPGIYDRLYEQWLPALERKKQRMPVQPAKIVQRREKILYTPKRLRSGNSGYVYLIEAVGTPRIKIGHTRNVQSRLAQLSAGAPYPLRLLHTITATDSAALESALHARYGAYRQHNEWYVLPPDVLNALLKEVFS